MTYLEAKTKRDEIEKRLSDATGVLCSITGVGNGPMGLTPDAIKASESYRQAKRNVDAAFAQLRAFNGWFTKQFKQEIREERRA